MVELAAFNAILALSIKRRVRRRSLTAAIILPQVLVLLLAAIARDPLMLLGGIYTGLFVAPVVLLLVCDIAILPRAEDSVENGPLVYDRIASVLSVVCVGYVALAMSIVLIALLVE